MKIPAGAGREKEMEPQIISLQLALFFKELMRNPQIYGNEISSQFEEFSGMPPMVFQGGTPIQFQIPTQNTERIYSLSVASDRMDFFTIKLTEKYTKIKEDFTNLAQRLLEKVCSTKELVRIGMISTLFIKDDNPVTTIANNYFSDIISDGLIELSFRKNIRSNFENILTNHIFSKESTLNNNILGTVQSGIIIRHDINTTLIENGIQPITLKKFFDANTESLFKE